MATRPKQITTQYVAGAKPPSPYNRATLRRRLDEIETWCAGYTGNVVSSREAHVLGICAELAGAIRFVLDQGGKDGQ